MLQKIRNLIRNLIQDNDQSDSESFTAEAGNVFTLSQENASSITKLTINGVELSASKYSYDSSSQTITIDVGEVSVNDIVIIYYIYNKYSTTELLAYIKNSLAYLSVNQYYPTFELNTDEDELYPIPSIKEQNLISVIASILIKPEHSEYRTASVTIRYPKTDDRDTKIKKLINTFKRSGGICGIINMG